jgi:type IV pilus assembly protein PilB
MRLGDLLIFKEYVTAEQLESALEEQAQGDGSQLLGELLVNNEYCTEEQVLECLALEYRIPYVQLDSRMFDSKIFDVLPREFVEKHTVLPLFKVRNVLTVAVAEPTNVFLVDQLRDLTKSEIQIVAASAREIRKMVQTYMPNTNVFVIDDIIDDANGTNVELIEESIDDIGFDVEFAGQSPIIKLVNYIIYNAVREGASDIHIEPNEQQLRVRYRVDGVLHQALEPPVHLAPAVSSRIKIMASLDISERRLPQDGRIHVLMEGRPIDLRVSTLPMPTGEKVVIRILDNRSVNISLEQLGFSSEVLENFTEQLEKPNGIILVTGPTGSGKSTTLYAALNAVSSIEKNVCTVEDPIEYQLPIINQFQVNEKIGLSFATILRSLLRQDPDVVMVGEIRDQETGKIAIQAALTGHLVFSTLHTNDAISAITRLINMGVDDYLIAAAVNMALAQRLCRKLCPKCKTPYELPKSMQLAVEHVGLDASEFFKNKGCKRCRNTGFSGRIGVHEILTVDDPLREIISSNPTVAAVKDYAQNSGMIPLRYDALRKAQEGLTTVEEAIKVSDEGWIPRKPALVRR